MAEGEKKGTKCDYMIVILGKDLPLVESYVKSIIKAGRGYGMTGPNRYPIRKLSVTTRKSPCGEGSNTWDHFELRMYKRTFKLEATIQDVNEILTKAPNPAGIQVTIVADALEE